MILESQPIVQDLVLIGGGHAHAIALRLFGMKPLPGVRLTLITEASNTPYSGMLPGHVAGFYTAEECHIDLRPLCQFAGAQLYIDSAVGLDLAKNRVICANRPPVRFDLLSIDIGSTPQKPTVLGDEQIIIPAKPVPLFLENWRRIVEQVTRHPEQPLCLGIVGGGVGGVELAMNMQSRLRAVLRSANKSPDGLTFHLFHRGAQLMPQHNRWVRSHFHQLLIQRGIQLHLQEEVYKLEAQSLHCKSGLVVNCDYVVWVTQAAAPEWLKQAGLAVDAKGFVLVDDTLRSLSHPQVFAAGDIATMVNHPRPKAGVFAVRQGKPLVQNLQRALQGKPLKPFSPQKHYLSLIGTGDRSAVASRGPFGWHSPLLWTWKDAIDRTFMEQFSQLPEMPGKRNSHQKSEDRKGGRNLASNLGQRLKTQPIAEMRCAGCGAKVGSTTLERVLQRIQSVSFSQPPLPTAPHSCRPDILIGLEASEDAAVVQVPAGMVMVQTVDYFPAFINDPFLFGQISAHHALSDLFAMGAEPQSALAIATVPYGSSDVVEETLFQLLAGALKVLHEAKADLIGGHTTEARELAFGLSCNGLANPQRLLHKRGMKQGQVLILTKAIGTGVLFAASMRQKAKGHWIDGAIESMLQSNQKAATCFLDHHSTACTDITGFGLMGHLLEMTRAAEGVAVQVNLEAVPLLSGALETTRLGITSSLYPQNFQAIELIENVSEVIDYPQFPLLFDPQTSGGLLAAVPEAEGDRCLAALRSLGYTRSAIIGHTLPHATAIRAVRVVLS